MNQSTTCFAPQLYIKHGISDISFYEKAFADGQLWQSSK